MRATSKALAVVLASASIALGACSDDTASGSPTPAGSGASDVTAGQPSPTTTARPEPTRPAELTVDGIEPCTLITDAARATYAIDVGETDGRPLPGTAACVAVSSTVGRYVVAAVTDQGMDGLADPGTPITIGGFPAARVYGRPFPNMCHVSIDIADTQRLDVEIQPADATSTQDKVCQDTSAFAETVLAELRQRLGR